VARDVVKNLQPMKDKSLLGAQFEMSNNKSWSFNKLKQQKVILYFYPKDSTPGCTTEGLEFSQLINQFKKLGYLVLGVSKDSVSSHDKFICKYNLKIDLISDSEGVLCDAFEVIKEKNMYGKKVMGIERSTFVLNEKMEIIHEFRKVKALGHAAFVLKFLQSL